MSPRRIAGNSATYRLWVADSPQAVLYLPVMKRAAVFFSCLSEYGNFGSVWGICSEDASIYEAHP